MGVKDKSGGSDPGPQRESNHNKDQEILEIRVNKIYMYILSLILLWFFFSIVLLADTMLSSWEIEMRFTHTDQWKLWGSIFLLIIFHEALHAVAALLWGRVPWSSIHFGVKWRSLMFYCHCDKLLKVNTFRILVLLPLIITTPIAGLIWWLDPSLWSLLLFSLTIAFCSGDVLMFFKVRQVENEQMDSRSRIRT